MPVVRMIVGVVVWLHTALAIAGDKPPAAAPAERAAPAPPGQAPDVPEHPSEPAAAPAPEPTPEPTAEQPDATAKPDGKADDQADKQAKHSKKKHKDKKQQKLQAGGRIFMRSALVKVEGASDAVLQSTLQSARAAAEYRSHGLRTALSLELAGKARVKDAFLQLRLHDEGVKIDVRAGQFKMPLSAIELTSIWTLPLADRGVIHDVLAKRLQVAGRAVGAMLVIAWAWPWRTELRAGVFQGRDDADVLLQGSAGDGFGQDGVVRLTVEPVHGFELGVSGSTRAGRLLVVPIEIRRSYAGEVDARLDVPVGPCRLRAWLEGIAGTSWLVGGLDPSHIHAKFVETRALVGLRVGGAHKRDHYLELYSLAGALDPDADFTDDRVLELTAGAGFGTRAWRLQLEGEVWRVGDRAPNGIVELTVPPTDSTTVLLQLGAHI
jgi:hypothetical protein